MKWIRERTKAIKKTKRTIRTVRIKIKSIKKKYKIKIIEIRNFKESNALNETKRNYRKKLKTERN